MSLASTRLTMLLTASLNFSSSVKMGMLSLTTLSTRLSPTACRASKKLHALPPLQQLRDWNEHRAVRGNEGLRTLKH